MPIPNWGIRLRVLISIALACSAVVFALLLYYVLTGQRGPAFVQTQLPALRDLVLGETAEPEPEPPVTDAAEESTRAVAPTPRAAPPPAPPLAETPRVESEPPAPNADAPPSELPLPPTEAGPPPRGDYYLSGRRSSWTSFDVALTAPLVIRSAGAVWINEDAAGPDGIANSTYERQLASRRATAETDQRVLASAPYLALIGRICSADGCFDPFMVGSHLEMCPEDGSLQLWTNNYARVGGSSTLQRFSNTSGGFWLYTEPASSAACGGRGSSVEARSADSGELPPGQVLQRPEFVVSSSQNLWKPFFLPLNQPLRIRGSAQMRPGGRADPTGPDGVVVPSSEYWAYPGDPSVFVDADHQLFDPELPYLALIGRVCRGEECGRPLLVGTDRVLCPAVEPADRLELWINRIFRPRGLISSAMPLSMETFASQARRGEYRFEVSRAPAAACAA